MTITVCEPETVSGCPDAAFPVTHRSTPQVSRTFSQTKQNAIGGV